MSRDKFNLLVFEVESPTVARHKRFQQKHKVDMTFEDFASLDDKLSLCSKADNNLKVIKRFINKSDSLDGFFS